jgi:hypothetical protein
MGSIAKKVAEEIIANDGVYETDPRCSKIVTYENMFDGGLTYAIVYPHEDQFKYERSPACNNVKVIWQA